MRAGSVMWIIGGAVVLGGGLILAQTNGISINGGYLTGRFIVYGAFAVVVLVLKVVQSARGGRRNGTQPFPPQQFGQGQIPPQQWGQQPMPQQMMPQEWGQQPMPQARPQAPFQPPAPGVPPPTAGWPSAGHGGPRSTSIDDLGGQS